MFEERSAYDMPVFFQKQKYKTTSQLSDLKAKEKKIAWLVFDVSVETWKAAMSEESTKMETKEGSNLLGSPTFTQLENGRFKCLESGHEMLAKDKESYSHSKRCRLGLIDFALANNKPPLNMFKQDSLSRYYSNLDYTFSFLGFCFSSDSFGYLTLIYVIKFCLFFSSKLICKLTGDTVNKSEEHIWKHINGKRFLNKLGLFFYFIFVL